MSLRFKGGNLLQKGRGIGGLLRAASSLFKPFFKTVGNTALKVARSNTGKAIGKALKEQAISSAQNIALDTFRGENIKDSLNNEVSNVRKRVADNVEDMLNTPKKRRVFPKSKPNNYPFLNYKSKPDKIRFPITKNDIRHTLC